MNVWWLLLLAVCSEVIATLALKSSDNFTKVLPSIIVVIGYGAAFYLLTLTLNKIPLGIAYAVWAGLGIVLVSVLAWLIHDQRLDIAALIGIALIIIGVITIHLFSNTTVH
jgi:small multidrug resistance pump